MRITRVYVPSHRHSRRLDSGYIVAVVIIAVVIILVGTIGFVCCRKADAKRTEVIMEEMTMLTTEEEVATMVEAAEMEEGEALISNAMYMVNNPSWRYKCERKHFIVPRPLAGEGEEEGPHGI